MTRPIFMMMVVVVVRIEKMMEIITMTPLYRTEKSIGISDA